MVVKRVVLVSEWWVSEWSEGRRERPQSGPGPPSSPPRPSITGFGPALAPHFFPPSQIPGPPAPPRHGRVNQRAQSSPRSLHSSPRWPIRPPLNGQVLPSWVFLPPAGRISPGKQLAPRFAGLLSASGSLHSFPSPRPEVPRIRSAGPTAASAVAPLRRPCPRSLASCHRRPRRCPWSSESRTRHSPHPGSHCQIRSHNQRRHQ